jgi:phytoene dehydrogenase-like protein
MSKKVVIIGGGVAGLSAGIYGQMNGYDTEVIEMHTLPGGQCTAWDRKGYRFDYCLHWLVGTAKGPFNDVWRETNVITDSVKIINHEVHTKIFDEQGNSFIIYTDIDRWENYLIDIAPEDTAIIKKMCADMRKVSLLEPFSSPPALRGILDYTCSFCKMPRTFMLMMKYRNISCRDYFQKLNIKNQRLSFFLSNLYAERDFSALVFLMMFGWFYHKNAGYLIGGSLPLAERMAKKYSSIGGMLTLGRKVKNIIIKNDTASGVVLADGTVIKADYVVSAADGHATLFEMLESSYLSDQIEDAYASWPLFTPLVQVSFGIDKEVHTLYPVQTYLAKGLKIGGTQLDSDYTIMNYCFDPTMAPAGKTVIILRFRSPWELWKDLEGDAYRAEKKQIEQDSFTIMEKHLPGITAHIEVFDIATPKTDVRHTGVWKGAYEGFMPTSKNITKRLNMMLPGLKNFYMCGQWLFPGGGIPPSAQSGKWVIQMMCKQDKKNYDKKGLHNP